MGSFVNSIFSFLLGWLSSLASAVWGLFSGEGGAIRISWFAQNWKALAIIICLVGTGIDVVIHLVRWQPYKVWATFIRRLLGRQSAETEPVSSDVPVHKSSEAPISPVGHPNLKQPVPAQNHTFESVPAETRQVPASQRNAAPVPTETRRVPAPQQNTTQIPAETRRMPIPQQNATQIPAETRRMPIPQQNAAPAPAETRRMPVPQQSIPATVFSGTPQPQQVPAGPVQQGNVRTPYRRRTAAPAPAVYTARTPGADLPGDYKAQYARPTQSVPPAAEPAAHSHRSSRRAASKAASEIPVVQTPAVPQVAPVPRTVASTTPQPAPADPAPGRLRGIATRITGMIVDSARDDTPDLRYRPAAPAVDKNEAYNTPVYPTGWQTPASSEQNGADR